MDLSVLSGDVELNVSGVTEETSCLQIVYALAHATNQKGKFVLVAHVNGQEHRLSQTMKPLDLIKEYSAVGTPVIFELRHLDSQPLSIVPPATPSAFTPHSQSYSQFPLSPGSTIPSPSSSMPIHSLQQTGRTISLPANGFDLGKDGGAKKTRPPPPTYNEVIGQRCNSLSREVNRTLNAIPRVVNSHSMSQIEVPHALPDTFSRYSRQDLERIVQQQSQFLHQQKSQLLSIDVTLSDASERELLQLKKQHNNLITVLNSLRNANWPLQMVRETQEAIRLQKAIEEMKHIVESRKSELMELLAEKQNLESMLDAASSDADTISQTDDATAQYWSISDYAVS
uniref:Ras-associating domain-containing protein n=1 Tax=Panagrellus redivivus TaxID=6233 RepID=A0A7E4VG47_PANRE